MASCTIPGKFIITAILLLAPCLLQASPETLNQWEQWIITGQKTFDCPYVMSKSSKRICEWPGSLDMQLQDKTLTFTYSVDVYRDDTTIQLPGDAKHWPSQITLNGQPAPVVEKNKKPYIAVGKGNHQIYGQFQWQRKPTSLHVPTDVAFVSLVENGKVRAIDRRNGQVVFSHQGNPTDTRQRDSLKVEVYRQLMDGVPLGLRTVLTLSVSGKAREIKIGQLAWQGTEVVAFKSRLPARIESDGDIRVQVVPGEHRIEVASRFLGNVSEIRSVRRDDHWPAIEYLSFQSNTDVRQAKLLGATSIDTSQVMIPEDWDDLPTYRLDADTTLQLITEFRGDHSPAANHLTVKRELWLDFDGGALTGRETVEGIMHRDWRLNASTDTHIGRASVAEQPVLITEDDGIQGIEIRSPEINLSAITRIDSHTRFSTNGWDARADEFSASLHTPPGWRVLHASGVDFVKGTWISKWDLWDIFLLLIIIAATRKLLGIKTAVLATLALVVSYHESGVPVALFAALLLILALLPALSGRLKKAASTFGALLSAALVLMIIAYSVTAFRLAIYPSLERSALDRYDPYRSTAQQYAPEPVLERPASLKVRSQSNDIALEEVIVTARKREENLYELDDNDRVQTGPGQPTWLWNTTQLRSNSPVTAEDQISVSYSPPWLTSTWRVSSVFLLGLYAALLISALAKRYQFKIPVTPTSTPLVGVVLITGALLSAPPPAEAEDFPPDYLIKELEQRVLELPACLPDCASLDQGRLNVNKKSLHLQFNVYADTDLLLPLPTGRDGWQVSSVNVDNSDRVVARQYNGQLALRLTRGHHSIVINGDIIGDQASISFPIPIHNFNAMSEDWVIEGLVDGRIPSKTLSLRARVTEQQEQADTLIPDPVKPFVLVHRELKLGKQWRIHTHVERVAPTIGPLSVTIPLLDDEKPLSNELNFDDGKARLQFSGKQQAISWWSSISPKSTLQFTAADAPHYLETWRILPSSLWRIQHDGIPTVKEGDTGNMLEPFWRPWPSEQLTVNVTRPSGIKGPTHTLESAVLVYSAGKRVQKSALGLSIRSSLGEEYTVTLPDDAEVLSVQLDGDSLNIPADNQVRIPLQPGIQLLEIDFQQHSELGLISRTPVIGLPDGATNIDIRYELPRDRWPLYFNGPAIGPAMLYWGVMCVIVLGAFILNGLAKGLELPVPVTLVGWLLLGLGLSTVNSYGVLAVAIFFFLVAWRKGFDPDSISRTSFNSLQLLIVVWTMITAVLVLSAIPMGLLSSPDMKVVGNDSWSHYYNFYQDRIGPEGFPTVTVVSVSLFLYRVVMLAWSLWLATRLIQWAGWWWQAFSHGKTWGSK